MRRLSFGLALISSFTACGYTDGGGGSNTLEVIATLEYRTSENEMASEVQVRKSGAAVEGATITLTDGETDERFVAEQQNSGQNVRYRVTIPGYHRRIAIKVEQGSDDLHGQLEGPGTHIITSPSNAQIVDRSSSGDDLSVRWKTTDGIAADEVTLRLSDGDYQTTLKDDHGKGSIPVSKLGAGDETVHVIRRNRVTLEGGVGASALEISYHVENTIVVND